MPFVIFFFVCFNDSPPHEAKDARLKDCHKSNFFSIELIKITNSINSAEIHLDFCYFTLSKLHFKKNKHMKFYQLLILLSGDISLNPGPCQYMPDQNKDLFEPFCKRGLHFLHINVNSLPSKIEELRNIVGCTKPAILGITESKLDSSIPDQEVNISGYSILRNDRNRNGGGVACYIRADLCFNRRNVFSSSIEYVFFDLLIPKIKPISIGIFYRPPNVNTFLETFLNDLKLIDFTKSEVYFLADFNINLLQNNKFVLKENQPLDGKNLNSPLLPKYKELCQTFSLKEIIQKPTRVTSSTSSLLDHILTNSGWKVSQKGVIDVGLSDHQLIYCTKKIVRAKTKVHNQIQVRSLNFPDYSIFSNVNIAYKDLVEKILSVVDKIAPFKVLRVKNSTQEWFDSEVAEAIDLRDKRLKHFKSTKLHVDEELYKEAKYQAQKLIKVKKKQFYKEKLKENIDKPKDLWKTLKSLGLPSKKGSNISNICLKKDDKINFDEKTNANTFKEFYCNLGGNLLKKLPPLSNKFGITSVRNFYQTMLDQLPFKFKFSNVTEDLVFKLLNDMNPDKAAGIDNLSGKFLKDGASILAKPISKICSLSIKYSLFPADCQIAKLKPLFKKGSTTHPKNYRPISLLPLISKIIEKVIHDQTQEFLDTSKILFKFQSGFRKGYSTDSCLSYLNNKIAAGFESGLHTGMILIDLQKAFDTINHEILIKKMKCLGFSKGVTLWFKSNLSNRKFKVNLNQIFSEPGNLLCGVPQGSILGLLLFSFI